MKKITFLFLLFLMPILVFSQGHSLDLKDTEIEYVRKNVNSPGGQADLEAMKIAFDKIRKLDCSNGASYYYQGAIHNVPGEINGPNELCKSYQDLSDKKWGWLDCTHSGSNSSNLNFLLWHRLYTWHLEAVVRKYSGKKDFALPYWNYGSPPGSKDNTLAAQVIDPKSSLYTKARDASLNNGDPIDNTALSHITQGIAKLQKIKQFGSSIGFSNTLQRNPHNFMHSYMGGMDQTFFNEIYQKEYSGLMSTPRSAGFDPAFWLHHAMVDRIWYNWDLKTEGKYRPSLEELEALPWTYNFILPDGTQKSYTMEEVYNMVYDLNYTYDNKTDKKTEAIFAMAKVDNKSKFNKRKVMKQQEPEEVIVWSQKIVRPIGKKIFSHSISKRQGEMTKSAFSLKQPSHKILRLSVIVYKEPSDYYSVHIVYPNKEEKFIGVMNFFGVTHEHSEGDGGDHSLAEEGVKLNFAYHVTDELIDSEESFDVVFKKHGTGDVNVTLESMTLSKIIKRK